MAKIITKLTRFKQALKEIRPEKMYTAYQKETGYSDIVSGEYLKESKCYSHVAIPIPEPRIKIAFIDAENFKGLKDSETLKKVEEVMNNLRKTKL